MRIARGKIGVQGKSAAAGRGFPREWVARSRVEETFLGLPPFGDPDGGGFAVAIEPDGDHGSARRHAEGEGASGVCGQSYEATLQP